MAIKKEQISSEYSNNLKTYEGYLKEVLNILNGDVNKQNVSLAFPISARIKQLESIIEKVEQKKFIPSETINEIQDIIGFRIVLLYKNDLDELQQIIQKHFPDCQIKDRRAYSSKTFGYSSIHYICKPPRSWNNVAHLSKYKNLLIEIQVRTLSEHIWAECSHSLSYKSKANIPLTIERPLNRLSGLLEIVDDELMRIKNSHHTYLSTTNNLDLEKLVNEDLNSITLEEVLFKIFPKAKKLTGNQYSQLNKVIEEDFEIRHTGYLVEVINRYKNNTAGEVNKFFELGHDDIMLFILTKYKADGYRVSSHEGV